MNIKKIKILNKQYFLEIDEKYFKSTQKYSLENNSLPIGHELNLNKDIYIVIGENSIGKTSFLRGLKSSIISAQNSRHLNEKIKTSDLPLGTEWKRNLDEYAIRSFSNISIFQNQIFKDYSEKNESLLIKRINRSASKIPQEEIRKLAKIVSKDQKIPYIEALNRIAYIAEAGINIINSPYPESIFGTYELFMKEGFSIKNLGIIYKNFSNSKELTIPDFLNDAYFYGDEDKGTLSPGEKTFQIIKKIKKESESLKNSLILLDEPTNFLSENRVGELTDILLDISGQKIIVTHHPKLINAMKGKAKYINFYKAPVQITDLPSQKN